jgi:hypothetical protein
MLAVHEPRLDAPCSVDLHVINLGRNVTPTVCWARRLRRALTPVNVMEPRKPLQQLEAEHLEFRLIETCEIQLLHEHGVQIRTGELR